MEKNSIDMSGKIDSDVQKAINGEYNKKPLIVAAAVVVLGSIYLHLTK